MFKENELERKIKEINLHIYLQMNLFSCRTAQTIIYLSLKRLSCRFVGKAAYLSANESLFM